MASGRGEGRDDDHRRHISTTRLSGQWAA
jgi:hypothetical protein